MTEKTLGKRAVLAFSGGLDTSFCVPYLVEQGYEVTTVTVDTGGFSKQELSELRVKALALGATQHREFDGRAEVYERFGAYVIKGNILKGNVYPLCVGVERVVQAEKLVEVAKECGASAVCHGCTGAGNDQLRFDIAIRCLAPDLKIIAPIRELALSREESVAKLKQFGFDFPLTRKKYSINQGILGTTIGGGETHDAWSSVPDEAYTFTVSPRSAPVSGEEVSIVFEQGVPVGLNGASKAGVEILEQLNTIGAQNGYGRGIHLGDTALGIKGRIAFEAPGILALVSAHRELEKLVLTKWQSLVKQQVAETYGTLLHEGQYFNPVMRDIEALIDSSQKFVSGEVRLRFCQGQACVEGVRSNHSLMNAQATYGEGATLWSGEEARGFCALSAVPTMLAMRQRR